jgi:hypothetical protein
VREEGGQPGEGLEAHAADRAVGRDGLHGRYLREAPLAAGEQARGFRQALHAAPPGVRAVVLSGLGLLGFWRG